jgi:uncharacterized membrane protein YbhN (UPF0104 family)
VFAPAGDGSTRRRASDAVGLGTALLLVVGAIVLMHNPPAAEGDIAEALTPPPDAIEWLVTLLWFVGSVGATAVVVLVALVARRFRVALRVAIAVAVAWAACGLLGWLLGGDGGRPVTPTYDGIDLGFPLARIAVAVAVAGTIAPYLSRPFRRLVLTLVGLAAAAAVLQGSGLPLDVLASMAVGWAVAAALRLIFGSPTGLPSAGEVVEAALDLGLDLSDVDPVRPQVWGVARFTGSVDDEVVDISIYGRDAADAQLLAKAWRFLWFRDSGPTLSLTRLQQVEHEAYLDLAASRAGLRAPDVLVAALTPAGDEAALITRPPPGRPLAALAADELTDDLLDAVFEQLGRLRSAGIAHGSLSPATVVVGGDGGVGLRDFSAATSSATPDRLDRDLGGLLIVVALVADPGRSVAAAMRILGTAGVGAALPQIQPLALDRATRHLARHDNQLVARVRDEAAGAVGVETPQLADVHRVSLSGLFMAIAAVFGLSLIVREFAGAEGILTTLKTANPWWVFAVFVVAQSTNVAQAWSVIGSVSTPLPFGPTLALEFANAFTGLVAGTLGTTATIIRFFQRRGLAVSVAVSSGLLVSVAGMATQAVLFVGSAIRTRGAFDFSTRSTAGSGSTSSSSTEMLLLGAIVLVAVLVGVLTAVPRFRRVAIAKLQPQMTAARDNLHDLRSQPGKLVRLFGGAAGAQVLFAVALGFSLRAYGTSLPLAELIVVNTIASLLGGVAPVPGGLGVIEAGLIAGLTAAGVPNTIAVAATLTQRMFTCYLPPLWGYPTLAWMRRHEYL